MPRRVKTPERIAAATLERLPEAVPVTYNIAPKPPSAIEAV